MKLKLQVAAMFLLTPPIGLNVFVMAKIAPDVPMWISSAGSPPSW
jgi:TRAP-type C4-dicarboxylate transport system permease large subunit